MAHQEQLNILKQGVETWNQWRQKHTDTQPDLSDADLSGANLSGVNLSGVNLSGATLRDANLYKADLSKAVLIGADLNGAYLRDANLSRANLCDFYSWKTEIREATLIDANLNGANLSDATLWGVNLSNADLSNADLKGVNLFRADLSGADLSGADLSNAYVRNANLTDALVSSLKYLDRKHKWFHPRSIMRGKYRGIRVASCYGNAIFKRDAEDQDFLDTLEHQWEGTWRIWLFRAWGIIDYGRSMFSVFLIAGFLIMFFGSIYLVFPGLISYSPSHPKTWFSPYYFSIVTFTTLGFGDITANGVLGEMVVSLQVILGYLTLGLLISILANNVARRS
jgi:uncharacterized protein YjbI with pentapeptide repeats